MRNQQQEMANKAAQRINQTKDLTQEAKTKISTQTDRRSLLKSAGLLGAGVLGFNRTVSIASSEEVIQFPDTPEGCASVVVGTLTNPTDEQVIFNIVGENADQFVILSPNVLEPDATQDFDIAFVPTSAGEKQATLVGTHPDGETAVGIPLAGTAIALANVDVTAENTTNFGEVSVGSTQTATVTQQNVLPNPVEIVGSRLAGPNSGEFSIQNLPVGQVIQPGESYSFTAAFSLTSIGQKSTNAQVNLRDTVLDVSTCALYRFIGTGVESQPSNPVEEFLQLIDEATQLLQQAIQLLVSGGSIEEVQELLTQVGQLIEEAVDILSGLTATNNTQTQMTPSTTEEDLTEAIQSTEEAADSVDESMAVLDSCNPENSRTDTSNQLTNALSSLNQAKERLQSEQSDNQLSGNSGELSDPTCPDKTYTMRVHR